VAGKAKTHRTQEKVGFIIPGGRRVKVDFRGVTQKRAEGGNSKRLDHQVPGPGWARSGNKGFTGRKVGGVLDEGKLCVTWWGEWGGEITLNSN